ncbi:MAG TPA: hypothetical protein EYN91_19995 [Candidatus Melainabacteria bacterium]|jgi:hypothetical protein|nr:hypothetical protein [Candidatus Melainabacteria bacterium]
MAEMNVWQKLDKAEQSLKTGDYNGLKEAAVISGEGQHTFMATLADRMKGSQLSLPDLQIVDLDKDGSPEKISAKGLTIQKDGQKLSVETSSITTRISEKISSGWQSVKDTLSDAVGTTKVGDALNRANTTDSELNRRWERQMKQAGM